MCLVNDYISKLIPGDNLSRCAALFDCSWNDKKFTLEVKQDFVESRNLNDVIRSTKSFGIFGPIRLA